MRKEIFRRVVIGMPLGITIGYLITIAISLGWAHGNYLACAPQLIESTGSEAGAVLLQAVLCAILGGFFAGGSVVWEMDEWSLLKRTAVYFIIGSLAMLPTVYFAYWMDHTAIGILQYFGIFAAIFAVVWLIQCAVGMYLIRRMNDKLRDSRE